MKTLTPTLLGATLAALLPSLASASCGASFCAVNTNWTSEGALAESRNAFDLRYEYINQDQPMTGTRKLAVGEIHAHHDEVRTDNRNAVLRYSHGFGNGFGVEVAASVGKREHLHIHNHHGAQIFDSWNFTEPGDVRVTGRYQLLSVEDPLKPTNAGIIFGLKLPTGKFDVANAKGAVGERSMQPGTGTTDLIVGGYYHRKLTETGAAWFAQGQYQHALNGRDNFRPGAQLGLDFGVRHSLTGTIGALAQINVVVKRSDSGSQAEPESSGGRFLYASPGLSMALPGNTQAYLFYQVPLYRHVTGIQLTAKSAIVLGISGQL